MTLLICPRHIHQVPVSVTECLIPLVLIILLLQKNRNPKSLRILKRMPSIFYLDLHLLISETRRKSKSRRTREKKVCTLLRLVRMLLIFSFARRRTDIYSFFSFFLKVVFFFFFEVVVFSFFFLKVVVFFFFFEIVFFFFFKGSCMIPGEICYFSSTISNLIEMKLGLILIYFRKYIFVIKIFFKSSVKRI